MKEDEDLSNPAIAAVDKQDRRQIEKGVFRRNGEFWTLEYDDKLAYVQNSKGLAYILHLLRSPGAEYHVFDLIEGTGDTSKASAGLNELSAITARQWTRNEVRVVKRREIGDSGELLDEKAIASYRKRLSELRDEIEDASQRDDAERAARAQEEMDILAQEVSRAVGIGARRRRAGSASERARISVRKAIKYAIDRIDDSNPSLATLLSRTIATGNFCSYNPGPAEIVDWDFGPSGIGVTHQEPTVASAEPGAVKTGIDRNVSNSAWDSERTRFVGREAERKQIVDAFERAFSGRGSLVAISGPPGVGKTRLALECAKEVSNRSPLVLIGHSYETQGAHPFLPFVEMLEMALSQTQSFEAFRDALGENAAELCQLDPRLRRIFTDIHPPIELPPEQARRYLFESLCDFLVRSASARPLFLVLDDLQWADESTLSLLTHLARRIEQSAILVIATYRDIEINTKPVLLSTLEDLIRAGVGTIRLQGLPRVSVTGMLRSLSGLEPPDPLVDSICDETAGNPFFIEELFKLLIEEKRVFDSSGNLRADFTLRDLGVPENIKLLTTKRLERLSLETQRSLAGAAVIGRSFSFKLLDSTMDSDGDVLLDAIDEARNAGLIVASAEKEAPFAFVHEIVRQAILTSLSLPRRQRLHRRAAQGLMSAHDGRLEDHAAEIAHHLVQAGAEASPAEILRFSVIAGQRAMQAAAYEDALGYFEQALKCKPPEESTETANLLYEMGMTKQSLGRWEEALTDWHLSLDIFARLGDPDASGRVAAAIVEALAWAGRYFDAARIAYRGLSSLEGRKSADRVRLLADLGVINTAAGAFEPAHDALTEAFELAEDLHDDRTLGVVLSYLALEGYSFLRLNDAVAYGLRGARLLRASGSMWALSQLLGFLQITMLMKGDLSEALAIGDELEPLAAKIGHSAAMMLCGRVRAWSDFCRQSDLATLTANLYRDLEIVTAAKLPWSAGSYAQLAVAGFYSGDWTTAMEHARRGYLLEFPTAFDGYCTGALIRQCAYSVETEEALEILEQKRSRLPLLGSPNTIGSNALLLLSVEALYVIGKRLEAAELYPLVAQLIDTGTVYFAEISRFPQMAAAIAASAGGLWDIAEAHFMLALRQAGELPNPVEQLEIQRFYAQMLLDRSEQGDHVKAHNLLVSALQGYDQFKMTGHASIVRLLSGD